MPRDVEAMADVVITSMRAALAPVLERLAAAEARLGALVDVRDRLMVVETKAALPVTFPEIPPALDLSPLTERVASVDARLTQLEVSRDAGALTALHERMAVVETKAAMVPPAVDVAPLTQRQEALETAMTAHLKTALSLLDKDIGAVHERLALVESRAAIPGPAGADGKDGAPGKDGRDGIALDDLAVMQESERAWVIRARMNGQTKDLGTITMPVELYRGVWVEGRTYDGGDGVTWGGSEWHCHDTTTTKPGEGSKAWTLKVKRGRDGKDGRDAPSLPVVKVS